jgi:hypothetical protein
MLLIGHAGAKYGVPYAVLARASFGTPGARLPALTRAIVACGWYGIQSWFGGQMAYTIATALFGADLAGPSLPLLGIRTRAIDGGTHAVRNLRLLHPDCHGIARTLGLSVAKPALATGL